MKALNISLSSRVPTGARRSRVSDCFAVFAARNDKTLLWLIVLVVFSGVSLVYAQEMAGQGWATSEPRQHPSSAISMTTTEKNSDLARSTSGALVSTVVRQQREAENMPPFPVMTPKAIVYPLKAIRRGWEGQTVVAAEVLPDGSVGRTALAKSSGHETLDTAAQDAIKTWKFETESEKDEAVPKFVDIPVTFKLQSED